MQDKLNTNQNLQEDEKQVLLDNKGRSYATGKRKNSTARVWLKKGEGKIIVNGKTSDNYFTRSALRMIINQPFEAIDSENTFDVLITVKGGGLSGQAGAIRHGISKALSIYDFEYRPILKKNRFFNKRFTCGRKKKIWFS